MNLLKKSMGLSLMVAGCLAMASVAQAQATRTWVSGTGSDANPCSRTAPCQTFAGAQSKTAAGGEIDTLDPGGFGTISIVKSLTIDGGSPGGGGILGAGTTGVLVNTANVQVYLRNLVINGAGTGTFGIRFLNGLSLHLRNVEIEGFVNECVRFQPSATAFLFIQDAKFLRCSAGGVLMDGTTAFIRASIQRAESDNTGSFGFKALNQVLADVSDSVGSVAAVAGFIADGAQAKLFCVNCRANFNGTGVSQANAAEVRFLNGSIGHSTGAATTGTVLTTGTVFMP